MARNHLGSLLLHLRSAAPPRAGAGEDGELLERFIARRDDAAFEALVCRHGPMVLGVCRRVLRNEADAEDAFQATFLVLVKKATSVVPRALVGNWLYGVAHNTALKAKAMRRKRRAKEAEAAARPRTETPEEAWRQLQAVLDEELSRLPDRYRVAIVLCELEGQPVKEAARQLGWPQGTVASRLSRGRVLLAQRLARGGLFLSSGALAATLSPGVARAGVPVPVMSATLEAAALVKAGQTVAGATSAKVAALTEGVIKAMLLRKLKLAAVVLVLAALAAWGVGYLIGPSAVARPAADKKGAAKGKTEPPGVPLEARLVAKKRTYTLHLGGKTPEEFRKLVHTGHSPAAPEVDLVLEFRNTGGKEIKFLVGGSNPDVPLLLQLHGHGAVNATLRAWASASLTRPPEQVSLAPGKSYALAIKSLRTSNVGREGSASWWTEPGQYKLIATYQTAVSPVPRGAKAHRWHKGFGLVTLTSPPLALEVVKHKEASAEGKTEPPGVPLEARLVAKKRTYPLDLGGKTPEAFRKLLRPFPPAPPRAPAVDLTLEVRNTGAGPLQLCTPAGDRAWVSFRLHGPGAVNDLVAGQNPSSKRKYPVREVVTLAAGKKLTFPLEELKEQKRDPGAFLKAAYWTRAGAYTLTATFHTELTPPPKGARLGYGGDERFGMVTVASAPIKLQVVEGKPRP
jgi:RNA polymerase sigma factor (sigma-70 family)